MFVYNITIKIDAAIESDWLPWQKNEHIPEVMDTGLFTEYKFFRLLDHDDSDGPTYIVQFFANRRADYDRYIEQYAGKLRNKVLAKWGDGFVAFRTIMEVVN